MKKLNLKARSAVALVLLLISGLFLTAQEKVVLADAYGSHEFNKVPQKVVVFNYEILDSLQVLGVEVAGLPKSNIPTYLKQYASSKYEDLGTLFEPDFEKIDRLKPEIIFISARQAKLRDSFAKIAPTVLLTADPANYLESFRSITLSLGKLFNKEAAAQKALENVQGQVDLLLKKAKEKPQKALYAMVNDKAVSVFGSGSRFSMVFDSFGFVQADPGIAASTHGQSANFEYLLKINPDVLFVLDRAAAIGSQGTAEQVLNNPLVRASKAWKNKKIIYVDPQAWYLSTGGIQSTQQMLKDLLAAY